MVPTVFVQVPDPQHEHAADMIGACTQALRRGRCELVVPGADARPEAVAIVSWVSSDYDAALVEVGTPAHRESRWVSRSIAFKPDDPLEERWRVVGITIAILVGDLEPRPSPPPAPPPRSEVDAVSQPSPDTYRWWLSVGGSVDPGLTNDVPRGGAWGRAEWSPVSPVVVTLAASYVQQAETAGVTMRWVGLTSGSGVAWTSGQLGAYARVEVLLEHVSAQRSGVVASKFLGGARGGLGLAWPASRPAAVTAGAQLTRHFREVRVVSDTEEIRGFPAVSGSFILGSRFAF
jgi:hypothetical protein